MRGVLLSYVPQPELWSSRPSFSGRTLKYSHYSLSIDVPRVQYYISHAWPDASARKVGMLRDFLCLHSLLGRLLVVLPVLALFLLPFGFGVASLDPHVPFWLPSVLPLGLLLLVLAWVALSSLGLVPMVATPWGLNPTVVWVDMCCLNQATPETISAGIAGFKRFVESSEKMVAFASPAYFERLWCVYELATFCKRHAGAELRRRLLLLSLEWPGVLAPWKRQELSAAEEGWLQRFRCVHAKCFKPSDRAMLLARIRDEWGSEEAFDEFVRTELREVMMQSKAQYQRQMSSVAADSFDLLFGD